MKNMIGVALGGGLFDDFVIRTMVRYFKKHAKSFSTRRDFGKAHGIDRNRVVRLMQALEITDLFD